MGYDMDKIWRCDCGGQHFLSITSTDCEAYITLEGNFDAPSLRRRLKAFWKFLRHGHYDTWMEILLTSKVAREIANELLILAAAED